MNRIFSGSGDKVVSFEEVGLVTDEEKSGSVTENVTKYKSVEEYGDNINQDHGLFEPRSWTLKPCEVCARKFHEFDDIDTNKDEIGSSNEVISRLDHKELSDVTCGIIEFPSVLDSLKLDLDGERIQLEKYRNTPEFKSETHEEQTTKSIVDDLSYPTDFFTTTVDSKLCSGEDLKEYEKQLQSYQRTLNIAQNVKKNAIRKQMLAKAFKLKLLEVENQCNIELLRIKQNLQCLEPLKLIAESWKTETSDIDLSKYDLSPLFPDILLNTASDTISTEYSQEKQSNE